MEPFTKFILLVVSVAYFRTGVWWSGITDPTKIFLALGMVFVIPGLLFAGFFLREKDKPGDGRLIFSGCLFLINFLIGAGVGGFF